MAAGYRFIDHTADVEFIAEGRGMSSAFRNSFLAFANTMSDAGKVARSKAPRVLISVEEEEGTLEDLLWAMLQDILSISDADGVVPYAAKSVKVWESGGSYRLKATVYAKHPAPSASRFDVKGVTRYNLEVKRSKTGFTANVVLDV
ncbi:MAG: archease [Candidatus Marsarchaeota archaeon]|jgi:SHS2 domain-containing protein|nr:archease [Candidatus Marsarchaeota archaeon]